MNFQNFFMLFCILTLVIGDMWDDIRDSKEAAVLLTLKKDSKLDRVFEEAKKRSPDIKFFILDCTDQIKNKKYCSNTPGELRLYVNGKQDNTYNGDSSIDDVLSFLITHLNLPQPKLPPQPQSKGIYELTSATDLTKLLSKDEDVVIGAFEKETKLRNLFFDLAQELKGQPMLNFVWSSSPEVMERLGTKNGIVVYPSKHKELKLKPIMYNGTESMEDIRSFVVEIVETFKTPPGVKDTTQIQFNTNCGVKMNVLQTLTLITSCVVFRFLNKSLELQ